MTTPLVLLTGGTGFVGRHVLRALLAIGARVRAVVREGKQGDLEQLGRLEGVITTPDLFGHDGAWWGSALEGVDTIIHAAWYAEPGQYLQSPRNLDCLAGTLQMAKGAASAGTRRFVGLGTCFEYELSSRPLTVGTRLQPQTPYAAAKAAAFLALSRYLPQQQVQFAWCRLFYLHGEGEDPRRLVPYIRSRLAAGQPAELTRGTQVRDFMHVADAAAAIVAAATDDVQGAVNVCSGQPVTVRELAERVADEVGRRDLLQFGARADNLVDPPVVVGVPGQGCGP